MGVSARPDEHEPDRGRATRQDVPARARLAPLTDAGRPGHHRGCLPVVTADGSAVRTAKLPPGWVSFSGLQPLLPDSCARHTTVVLTPWRVAGGARERRGRVNRATLVAVTSYRSAVAAPQLPGLWPMPTRSGTANGRLRTRCRFIEARGDTGDRAALCSARGARHPCCRDGAQVFSAPYHPMGGRGPDTETRAVLVHAG